MECRTNSKKHCQACEHYDYCVNRLSRESRASLLAHDRGDGDFTKYKANRCNGDCHLCDDYNCENNPYPKRKQIGVSELYALCNKQKLFTCGTTEQYNKMFELAKNGITQFELAYILFLCSTYRLDVVYGMIEPLFKAEETKHD